MKNDEKLRYPAGRFSPKEQYTFEELQLLIDKIAGFPSRLQQVMTIITPKQMDTRYREGGWTLRQVIHLLSDSHMNAYIRLKWTLTENSPTIKAYDEKRWAETVEVSEDPQISMDLLTSLHAKWVRLLKRLTAEDLARGYMHPVSGKFVTLAYEVGLYAWHGDHHLGHLRLVTNKGGCKLDYQRPPILFNNHLETIYPALFRRVQ